MKRINYHLFRQRKNFDPTILFKNNLTLTYEDFSTFFIERNVEPPTEKYYINVKKHCENLFGVTLELHEDITTIDDVKTIGLEIELSEGFVLEPEEVKETVKLVKEALNIIEEKPKKQRRRKKKAKSDE